MNVAYSFRYKLLGGGGMSPLHPVKGTNGLQGAPKIDQKINPFFDRISVHV